ncbi:Putative uncharacterized protein [Moritella viscosa]|nr:Putative uncharacterized protein [Moritella viscosa]
MAIALYSKKITISLTELNAILDDKGVAYGNNRGLASGVAAAYRHWDQKRSCNLSCYCLHFQG